MERSMVAREKQALKFTSLLFERLGAVATIKKP